jgi:hypothetical protein
MARSVAMGRSTGRMEPGDDGHIANNPSPEDFDE